MTVSAPEDAAWVSVETPLEPEALRTLVCDAHRLLRLNSLFEFREWRTEGAGRFFVRGRNLANGRDFATAVTVEPTAEGCRIAYAEGLKSETRVRIEPMPGGTRLTLTDDYSGVPPEARAARLDEVDSSLGQWGRDLHRFCQQWARWSWLAPWRWYMNGYWLRMKPSARRIAFLLIAITAAEFAVFLLVAAIFWLES